MQSRFVSAKLCIYHLNHLGFRGDEEKNVCVTYMEINVSFLHCLARWWQYFLQIGYVIVCIFQAACLYFPLGFDFLRCQKHSEGRKECINFYKQTLSLFPRQIQCTFCWVIGIQEVTCSVLTKCVWMSCIYNGMAEIWKPKLFIWEKVIKKTQWEIRVYWLSCRFWHLTQ